MELSWSHHRAVAARKWTPEQKQRWLDLALENRWSHLELRSQMRDPDRALRNGGSDTTVPAAEFIQQIGLAQAVRDLLDAVEPDPNTAGFVRVPVECIELLQAALERRGRERLERLPRRTACASPW
jgi:hypothetical protein